MDVIAFFLARSFNFPGKWRIIKYWTRKVEKKGGFRVATLPNKVQVNVDLSIPYERMVYIQKEEWDELLYLSNKLKEGDTFIDVGSNIGLWTLVAASSVGESGKVYSFEPNPKTFKKLQENIYLNQLQTIIELNQAAVTDVSSSVFFHCAVDHNVSSIKSHYDEDDTIEVKAISLDSVFSNHRIVGIKIDTEGYELNVLKGSAKLIEKCHPFLIIEFNTTLLKSSVLYDWDVYKYLTYLNYSAFTYDKYGNEHPAESNFTLDGYINLLFKFVRGL